MKLYLQTLQNRQVDEGKRQEFYRVIAEDGDRLLGLIEQREHADGRRGGARPGRLDGRTVQARSLWAWSA
jgi:hypothetical protein